MEYSGEGAIRILSGAEAVRKRPAMYVGSRDSRGIGAMLLEVLANAVDEHLAGRCGRIDVEVAEDGEIRVTDDGRGFLLESLPLQSLTDLHCGPTLDGHAPHVHLSGLQGVGLAAVVALCARFTLESGNPAPGIVRAERGRVGVVAPAGEAGLSRGTRVCMLPDPEIFGAAQVDGGWLAGRLREVAALFPGLRLSLADRRRREFHAPEGLRALLEGEDTGAHEMRAGIPREQHGPAWPHVQLSPVIRLDADLPGLKVRGCVGWSEQWAGLRQRSWVNAQPVAGGVHLDGLWRGLEAGTADLLLTIPARRRRAGMRVIRGWAVAALAVWLEGPGFAQPVRAVLTSPGVADAVAAAVEARVREAILYGGDVSLGLLTHMDSARPLSGADP